MIIFRVNNGQYTEVNLDMDDLGKLLEIQKYYMLTPEETVKTLIYRGLEDISKQVRYEKSIKNKRTQAEDKDGGK